MALLTAAEAALAIPGLTGTGEDTKIETLITRAGRVFARYCGYPPASVGANPTMESASYTLYNGLGGLVQVNPDGRHLRIMVWPVTAISAIYDDTAEAYGTAVTSTLYSLVDGDQGLVAYKTTAGAAWTDAGPYIRNIKIACTAGYSTVPDDLKQAAMMLVKHWWALRHVQGNQSVSQGQANRGRREETMPGQVKEILAPLRLPGVILAA